LHDPGKQSDREGKEIVVTDEGTADVPPVTFKTMTFAFLAGYKAPQ
jgi:hypothetical protein